MNLNTFIVATCMVLMLMTSEVHSMQRKNSKKLRWMRSLGRGLKLKDSSNSWSSLLNIFRPPKNTSPPSGSFRLNPEDEANLQRVGIKERIGDITSYFGPSIIQNIRNLVQRMKPQPQLAVSGDESVPMSPTLIIQTMKLSPEQIAELEEETRFHGPRLGEEVKTRLTPDVFHPICTSSASEALAIFLTAPRVPADFWDHAAAFDLLQSQRKIEIAMSGLVVDTDLGYLAAVPDGVVEKDGALVKVHVIQRPRSKGLLKMTKEEVLSRDNPLFYEVQGLLNIMNRKECILLVVSRKYVTPFTVKRDESFWRDEMLGKIVKFYEGTLAPKLSGEMLPRIRNLQVAANIAYGVISELDENKALDIYRRTQDGSEAYDVLWDESRTRIMPQHYHLVMHPNIPTKEKVYQILRGYYTSRKRWKWQQSSRKSFLKRYIDMHPEWTIKEYGGLIIDPAFPYLATFPTAYGYGSLQDQPQSTPKRQPSLPPKRKPAKRPSSRGYAVLALEAPQPPEVPKNGYKSGSTSGSKVDVDEAGSSPPRTKTRLQVIYEVVAFIPSVADEYQLNELYVDKGRTLLKRDSRFYYKVQGSMALSRVKRCLFILGKLGTKDKEILHSEVVDFDAKVWRELQRKLAHFYFSTYLVYHANPEFFKSLASGKTLGDLIAEDPFPTAEEVEAIAKEAKDDKKEDVRD